MANKSQFSKESSDCKNKNMYSLVLNNDSINTFDYVIEALTELLEMDAIQAEQIAMLVHYKGSCDIKSGAFDIMEVYKDILEEKGLTVSIKEKINF